MIRHVPKKKILLMAGDILLICLAYYLSPLVRYGVFVTEPINVLTEALPLTVIYTLSYYISDLYGFDNPFTTMRYLQRFMISSLIATLVALFYFFFFQRSDLSRGLFVLSVMMVITFTYMWRLSFEMMFKRYMAQKKGVLIIGTGRKGMEIYEMIKEDPSNRVIGFIDVEGHRKSSCSPEVLGDFLMLETIVDTYPVERIIIATDDLQNRELLNAVIKCKMNGISVYDIPSFCEELLGKIQIEHLTDLWFLNMPMYGVKKGIYNRRVKRVLNIILSITILTLFSPFFLMAVIAIKLDSKGPVFFIQKRVGLNGRPFNMVKFRTMFTGMENDRRFAGQKNDPRITKVGKILRKSRIDELPQLWNVLKGEMNIVGPRALMLEEVETFEKKVPYFSLRHSVKPGVTGWAQVNYPHGVTVEDALEKLKYDLFYIKNVSFFLDLHILLRTVRVMLRMTGAK
ncbi:MAG: sugar transferase [Syntrophorhabdaceae bacterium]|nr:sugar transferase [Syntrophorhabdaceae bacterium]